MDTKRTFDRFRDSNAAPVAIVAAVVIALTDVTCVAATVANHGSVRSQGATTVAATSGRFQPRFVGVIHKVQSPKAAPANERRGAETGTIEAPRECDLRNGIDSACTFN
jgi:hypothetical protein